MNLFTFLAEIINSDSPTDTLWVVREEEFHHLTKVLRLKVGDNVAVTNGEGFWAEGTLLELKKDHGTIQTGKPVFTQRDNSLSIALGALKPSLIDELLPSFIELGTQDIHIFLQDQVSSDRIQPRVLERWKKIALAATKQSRQAWIPQITLWKSLDAFLEKNSNNVDIQKPLAFTIRSEKKLPQSFFQKGEKALVLIGGEKDFSQRELDLLSHYKIPELSLGRHILRSYTAALASLVLVWDRLNSLLE